MRQRWLVAEQAGKVVGVAHSILVPVPPIYAGAFGPPGLLMEDCCVPSDATDETRQALLDAAEEDLIAAGAKGLLASSINGGVWEPVFKRHGYAPLTQYFAKSGLSQTNGATQGAASENDIDDIVRSSAIHRRILNDLHPLFWKPHPDADARFGAWMRRSLTLADRDMFVAHDAEAFRGYAISQPATPLHFPAPHDISGVGVIDDFYHSAFEYPEHLGTETTEALTLLETAEAAREGHGNHSVLVVCPAAWASKIALLQRAGYRPAMAWHIKRQL